MKHITLKTHVGQVAANLFLPSNATSPAPVVLVAGAWTTVKEQMPNTYAEALSNLGFAALTFDFRGWGETQDPIKYLEDPVRKTEDILAVIDAVSNQNDLTDIDTNNIFLLGVCASSGYMLDAATGNRAVRAVAAVAPWLHNRPLADAIYGGEDSVNELIELAKSADPTSEASWVEAASSTNEKAPMYQAPYYTETDRGLIPEYDNKFNVASWKGWLSYDAISGAKKQDKPLLLVASEAMALPAGTHEYINKAADNVEVLWLDDVTQFDFYDVPQNVEAASKAVVAHFRKNIG